MKTLALALSMTGILLLVACADYVDHQYLVAKARFLNAEGAAFDPAPGTLCIYRTNLSTPGNLEAECTDIAPENATGDHLFEILIDLEQGISVSSQDALRLEYTTTDGFKFVAEGTDQVTFINSYKARVDCDYTDGAKFGSGDDGDPCYAPFWSYFITFRPAP